jgi:hypothetical protein
MEIDLWGNKYTNMKMDMQKSKKDSISWNKSNVTVNLLK